MIHGEIIETDTIKEMVVVEKLSFVKDVTLLPNANKGTDGAVRGIVVQTEGMLIPRLIGNNASRSYVAIETSIKDASLVTDNMLLTMQLSQVMTDSVRLIEIGVDDSGAVWILVVYDRSTLNLGKKYTGTRITSSEYKEYVRRTYCDSLEPMTIAFDIADILFGSGVASKAVTVACTNPNTHKKDNYGNVLHLRNAQVLTKDKLGIILGSQSSGYAIVNGTGLCPASCGTHLNKSFGSGLCDRQVRNRQYCGIESNAAYEELPTHYRNLDYIVDSMPNVNVIKKIVPIVSIKSGDM